MYFWKKRKQPIQQSEWIKDTIQRKQIIRFRHRCIRHRIYIFLLCLILIGYGVGCYFAYRFGMKLLKDMPELNVNDLIGNESSKIYDGNGSLLTEIGTYYRENIHYDDVPESLIDAFLSIEDSRYFQHHGFDIPRFTKSAIETVIHHNMQGGSTFTMQLVKNTYFSIDAGDQSVERQATLSYKAQQIVLSMQLEQRLSKKEIFELYINKLNFGGRIRGVQKAAEYYFQKDISELTLSESALLAGIVNLPNRYNPYEYLDYATTRRNEVLSLMKQHGYISQQEYALAVAIPVENQLVGEDAMQIENHQYPDYLDVVLDEATQLTGLDPFTTGMDIYTALNPTVQEEINLIQNGTDIAWPDDLMQVAIVSMDNRNGEIIGIGGGRGYGENGTRLLSRATSQYKQPGSAVKPFLDYALGFEYLGYSLDEILVDKPITFPGESRVLRNFNNKYIGDVDIKTAIGQSLNIPAIETLERVTATIGGEGVLAYLRQIGFKRLSNQDFHMSWAIGGNTYTTTVKEMAGAFGMLINYGVYNEPHTIRHIHLSQYNQDIFPKNQNIQVISSGSAYLTTQLLQNNVSGPFYNFMQILRSSYPVYAKTGTTDWGTDGLQYGIPKFAAKDKWMISNTSNYTNAVWLGYDIAIDGAGTYFQTYKSNLNLPGQINRLLLNVQESIGGDISGVEPPSDVVNVQYASGTYPHVAADYGRTSLVSQTGLNHAPLIDGTAIRRNRSYLPGFQASYYNGILYATFATQNPCGEDGRNISLNDRYNHISMSGACLLHGSGYGGYNEKYYIEIYQNDTLIQTIQPKENEYYGYIGFYDQPLQVCGYFRNGRQTSDKICTDASK